ncbi:hypothetical protein [Erwinia sorbitola]|uniref:Lipoprotein n=1 Tax=Erwinia sorbitola TaxID=2681984 RepID=A0A6I6EV94_9GAMM|nr:hypothetical protein [Erwinia sorbitola]MTD27493.1 hypothetical protein [Erwinia sorbitola]QGU89029.1 hypothetical protein GN242_18165 [Erwinia sorbitola]
MHYQRILPLAGLLLSGCSLLPQQEFFTPPPADAEVAGLRIMGSTESSALYQMENGKLRGGLIRKSEWVLRNTQDRGMPKVSGKEAAYSSDYFETPVYAGRKTTVYHSYARGKNHCMNIVSFVPEKGHYYQLSQVVDLKMYRCRASADELVKDAAGQWVLKPVANLTYGNKYLPQDGGWQAMTRRVSAG